METVKIKVKPCEGNPEGVVIINKSDYDPDQHELVGAKKAAGKDKDKDKDESTGTASGKGEKDGDKDKGAESNGGKAKGGKGEKAEK